MSRNDIGDYLGLTTETVSRTFTQLKTDGVIRLLPHSMVELSDLDALEEIAEGL
jgi:CRP/FNR family transcriptional regulator